MTESMTQEAVRLKRPPGPPGLPVVGNTLQFALDPLGFPLRCVQEYGEIVYLNVRGLDTYLLTNPDDIEQVFVQLHDQLILDQLSRGLSDALGDSLLVSSGSFWERQRRLVQPAFNKSRIHSYAPLMVEFTRAQIDSWQPGQGIDIHREMMHLMLAIVAKSLLNFDAAEQAGAVEQYLDKAMQHILGIARTGLRVPLAVPTPGNLACRHAEQDLNQLIYGLIDERRGSEADHGDLLSILLHEQDTDGSQMTDPQVRDELVTMLLVGHETSALALTYAFWLLAQQPESFERLCREVDDVLGGAAPDADNINQLEYAEWVFNETLRLYPPVWATGREALNDFELGGYPIRAGAQILLSPWVSHRNPRYFDAPDQFVPERWADPSRWPRYAYFPFGGGPRTCLGNRFARLEALIILATVAQRFTFRAASDTPLDLLPTVTLRPRNPVHLTVVARS